MNEINLTDDELSLVVHALKSNARADRERAEQVKTMLPDPRALSMTFAGQAEKQEKLAERLEQ